MKAKGIGAEIATYAAKHMHVVVAATTMVDGTDAVAVDKELLVHVSMVD